MSKTQKIVYYVLLVLATAVFLFTSYDKLSGDPLAAAGFAQAHLPLWFMYFIGVAELLGAIGLWIPKLQKLAAWGLAIILAGAVVTTVIYVNIVMAILPLVVGIILWYIRKLARKGAAAVPPPAPMQSAPMA